MKTCHARLRNMSLGAIFCFFGAGAYAQSSVDEIVRSQTVGNDFMIWVDPYALELFGDSVLGSLNTLSESSPYHESIMIIKKGNTDQAILDVNDASHDPTVLFADSPSMMFEFESDASENGGFVNYPLGTDYLQIGQSGVYTVDVSMELSTASTAMFPVTLTVRNTDVLDIASQQDVDLAASTVWVSNAAAPTYWVSTTMTVIMDNDNEKLHMDVVPYGGDVNVVSYKFVVSRIGAE